MMFLFLALAVLPLLGIGWNFNVYWYGGTAFLNADSSDEMSDSLWFTLSGILFNIHGGWLLLACT